MYQKPKLSLWEYLSFFGTLGRTVLALLGASLTAPFRGSDGAPTILQHVLYSALRVFNERSTIRQNQAVTPTTSEAYEAWAKSKGFAPQIVDIGNETVGCWIGDKDADVVILWLHGGGYVLMGIKAHADLIWNGILKAQERGKNVAGFLLQYDVAPQGTYPRQLIQAATALQYLIKDVGISPSQLLVGGDSAGGNLALALVSHILHPHTEVPVVTLTEKILRGFVIISPWVTFDVTAPAFKRNIKKDMLYGPTLKRWSDAFMGGAARDNYNTPLDASPEWWSGLPAQRVLVMAGKDEMFVDDVVELASKLKKQNEDKVEVFLGTKESHDAPVLDATLGGPPGEQTRKLYDWILDQI